MKYLKKYNESYKRVIKPGELNDTLLDIKEILMDIKDNFWTVTIDHIPKRWENPKVNFIIDKDYIQIIIKKKQNKSNSRYPEGSDFTIDDIREVLRLISVYSGSIKKIQVCQEGDDKYYKTLPKYTTGVWKDIEDISTIDRNEKILGVLIDISMDGENLDL